MFDTNSTAIIVSLITGICGVLGAYIVNRFKTPNPQARKEMSVAVFGYESLVKTLQRENDSLRDQMEKKDKEYLKKLEHKDLELETLRGLIKNR